ncbi:MAG: DegT/DnrJ/EryC1/StrS family aminotransferase [Nanoarchaeota archaeon]|nr:DegT/DnrJ/EryC1/StrS family aminotransferase [Nanoarchaeota archaeon]
MIPIAKPFLNHEEKEALFAVLNTGMLAQGETVKTFEQQFAKFMGVKHAIAIVNGTAALHAALLAHNIKEGDEVITTTFSFIATANAIRMAGATPVFVDIEENTFNLNPDLIESAITPKTKAIMPVHLFGLPAAMDKITQIAEKHGLVIIEDACQAHGAEYNGKKAGSFGTGCFSFYSTKNMTTGEGGMITTNDDAVAAKIRTIINHGSTEKYYHQHHGYNYRMTNLAAALGIIQLQKLEHFNSRRRENAAALTAALHSIPGILVPELSPGHVYHQYTIRILPAFGKTRKEVVQYLTEKGIGHGIFYPLPIHQQEAYKECNHILFPVAERAAEEVLSLPVHPLVTEENIDQIAEAFHTLQ